MKTKVIIIAVCSICIFAIVFGYTSYFSVVNDMEVIIETVSSIGKTVLKSNGLDFNEKLEYFLPPLTENSFGVYYDENLDEVKSVGKQIQRFLPLWLRNGEDDRISVTVYPTLYSVDFCYQVYELDLSNLNATGFHELNGPVKNYKAFSKQYCVRLYIKVPDYHGNIGFGYSKYNEYDVFIFYEGNYQRFFVCKDGSSTGIYASSLSDYYQYKQETDDTKKLTTVHELKIEDFNDNFFKKYRFSYVDRVQDTGLYLSSAFDLFMKGE